MSGTLKFFALLFFCLFFNIIGFAQVTLREPKTLVSDPAELDYLENSALRKKIVLNGNWEVVTDEDEQSKLTIRVPSGFAKPLELTYKKEFLLSKEDIFNSSFELNFLGLNYSAEISVNSSIIYKHGGGEFPIKLMIPRDLLSHEKPNLLTLRLYARLDSKNTIPLKYRFLNPRPAFGIFRDVYLLQTPSVSVKRTYMKYLVAADGKKVSINSGIIVSNNNYLKDTSAPAAPYILKVKAFNAVKVLQAENSIDLGLISRGKEISKTVTLEIVNPQLWSPAAPVGYELHYELYRGAEKIDEFNLPAIFYRLNTSGEHLQLNGADFSFKGVTYIPTSPSDDEIPSYKDFESDLVLIKESGFNAIRLPMLTPHPYLLSACARLGLLVFHELPLNSIPDQILEDAEYYNRMKNYLAQYIKGYDNFGALAAFGLGSGFSGESKVTATVIQDLTPMIKKSTNWLVYASFVRGSGTLPEGLDMYGLEFTGTPVAEIMEEFVPLQQRYGKARVFISEAGYLSHRKESTGYTSSHSYESQAKYFQDFLNGFETPENSGWFLHTMFDYRTSYHSIISGYNKDCVVYYGILGELRKKELRLGYRVISSRLLNLEKVTIPIGIKKGETPMVFIISGILMALLTGLMVNSGRKFREEGKRALLRPYNFYSDVRDHRMISGFQTLLLAVNVSGILGIIVMSLLYHQRESVVFEKLVLAMGNENITNLVSYLTWHPLQGILFFTALFILLLIILTLTIRLFSLFVMNKVFLSHTYYISVWSFIPVLLLIPVSVILFQVLSKSDADMYIYISMAVYAFWILMRIFKGVYVIYDASPAKVYGYGILFILLNVVVIFAYLHYSESTLYFIMQAFSVNKVV